MLRVSRPIEVVVLNCWVIETKETSFRSKTSTILAKSPRVRVRRSTLVDDDRIDPAGFHVLEKAFEGGALQGRPRDPAVIVNPGKAGPALVLLTRNIGFAGLPLGVEGVEVLLQPFFVGLARVYRTPDGGASLPALLRASRRHDP